MRVAHATSEHSPGCGCTPWHLSVAECFKSVHPMGHPISHSTHVGFNSPPICSLKGRELRSIVASLALPLRQSRAVGVAHFSTAVANPSPLVLLAPLRL